MKAITLFLSLITAIFSITTAVCSAQTPTIVYPVYPDTVVTATENIRSTNTVINGEGTECWEYEHIVIPTGGTKGAAVFRVTFDWHGILPQGFKMPIITEVGPLNSYPYYPLSHNGYWEYENGTKEYYGEVTLSATHKAFFYAWSWLDSMGREKWSTVVTWGEGAGVDQVGTQIDRSQFATRASEPRDLGFRILDIYTRDGKPVLGVFADEKAEFALEASPDLKNWRSIASNLEALPELDTWLDGVWFKSIILEPIPENGVSFGQKQFFRLRKLR
jgi:hypothetical protein